MNYKYYMILIIVGILSIGCESVVEIKERVIYPDGTPVKGAKVRQWTTKYKGGTLTNDQGEWSLTVPADAIINLCIEDPKGQYEACYQMDSLMTPQIDGGNEMIRIYDGGDDLEYVGYE